MNANLERYLGIALCLLATLGCESSEAKEMRKATQYVERKPWCTSDAMREHVLECVKGAGTSVSRHSLFRCETQARQLYCPLQFVVLYMGNEKLCSQALPEAQAWCRLRGWRKRWR